MGEMMNGVSQRSIGQLLGGGMDSDLGVRVKLSPDNKEDERGSMSYLKRGLCGTGDIWTESRETHQQIRQIIGINVGSGNGGGANRKRKGERL